MWKEWTHTFFKLQNWKWTAVQTYRFSIAKFIYCRLVTYKYSFKKGIILIYNDKKKTIQRQIPITKKSKEVYNYLVILKKKKKVNESGRIMDFFFLSSLTELNKESISDKKWGIFGTFQYFFLVYNKVCLYNKEIKIMMLCVKITLNVSEAKGVCGVDLNKYGQKSSQESWTYTNNLLNHDVTTCILGEKAIINYLIILTSQNSINDSWKLTQIFADYIFS